HPRPPRRRRHRTRPLQRTRARTTVEGAALLAVDDRDAARAPRGSGCLGAGVPLPQPGRPARVRHRLPAREGEPRRPERRPPVLIPPARPPPAPTQSTPAARAPPWPTPTETTSRSTPASSPPPSTSSW